VGYGCCASQCWYVQSVDNLVILSHPLGFFDDTSNFACYQPKTTSEIPRQWDSNSSDRPCGKVCTPKPRSVPRTDMPRCDLLSSRPGPPCQGIFASTSQPLRTHSESFHAFAVLPWPSFPHLCIGLSQRYGKYDHESSLIACCKQFCNELAGFLEYIFPSPNLTDASHEPSRSCAVNATAALHLRREAQRSERDHNCRQ